MTITFNEGKELRKRINKLVEAERAHEMRGAQPPEDIKTIDEELRVARKRINEYIIMLRLPDGRVRP